MKPQTTLWYRPLRHGQSDECCCAARSELDVSCCALGARSPGLVQLWVVNELVQLDFDRAPTSVFLRSTRQWHLWQCWSAVLLLVHAGQRAAGKSGRYLRHDTARYGGRPERDQNPPRNPVFVQVHTLKHTSLYRQSTARKTPISSKQAHTARTGPIDITRHQHAAPHCANLYMGPR